MKQRQLFSPALSAGTALCPCCLPDVLVAAAAGENEVEQMQLVVEVLGLPPATLMARASRKEHFFEADGALKMTPNKAGQRRIPATRDLAQALKCSDGPFLSFLQVRACAFPEQKLLAGCVCLINCAKHCQLADYCNPSFFNVHACWTTYMHINKVHKICLLPVCAYCVGRAGTGKGHT